MMGQLPIERVTPDLVFEDVGVDYARPVVIKHGYLRKPTLVKAYICIFVSLTVNAAHIELVSDLSTDAFLSTLIRFIAHQGKPKIIWSNHGTNFVGANNELKMFAEFLESQKTQKTISQFIPERSPHFGGLWESHQKTISNESCLESN